MSDDQETNATIEDISDGEKAARQFAPLLITRGVIGILAGLVLLFWPTAGLAVVAVAVGVFLSIDGIERMVSALRNRSETGRADALSILGALLRILIGAAITFNPVKTGGFWVSLLFIIAGINLVVGAVFGFWKNPQLRDDPMIAGSAILMLLLGLFMVLLPMISALFLFRILGGLLILAAIPSLSVGLRSR